MERGLVFEIREFCVHDGPGVRTTVFLKGCPLRCVWCQNPEGQEFRPQVLVSKASCVHCGTCVKYCPQQGEMSRCTACGRCTQVCPEGCRRLCGEWLTAAELAERVGRGRDFLQAGGGVTFSGGEPLMQGAWVLEAARLLKPLHVALETCGQAEPALYRHVVAEMDWVFQDLKLMNEEEHRRYTGCGNGMILENARWLLWESGRPCVIRVPLIPGVTDTVANLRAVAAFVSKAPNLQEVQLLPYNFAAGAKYALVGKEYAPPFDEQAPCCPDTSVFSEAGVRCQVM